MAGILLFCLVAIASANLNEYNYQRGFNQLSHHTAVFDQRQALDLPVLQIPLEIQAHIDSRTTHRHNAFHNNQQTHQSPTQHSNHFVNHDVQHSAQSFHAPSNGNSQFYSLLAPQAPFHSAPVFHSTKAFQNVYQTPVSAQPLQQQAAVYHQNGFTQHQQNTVHYENNAVHQQHAQHQHQQHHLGNTVLQQPGSPASFQQSFVAPVLQHFSPVPVQAQSFGTAPQYTMQLPAHQQHSPKSSEFNAVRQPAPVQQPVSVPAPVQLPSVAVQPHEGSEQLNHQQLGNTRGVELVVSPHVTKNFYFHVPPEDKEEQHQAQPVAPGPVHKHYRVIFIKAPSQSPRAALVRLAQAQAKTEEKTVIYVLSKKSDPTDIQAQLQQMEQPKVSKPEVYFIKYKTPDEAAHAQQQIQAQYDALGGTSHFSDEGVAPLQSVVGSLDSAQAAQESANSNGSQNFQSSVTKEYSHAPATQNRGYLPPVS